MSTSTRSDHRSVRLAVAAALVVAAAGCSSSNKGSPGGNDFPPSYGISGQVSGVVSSGVTVTLTSAAGNRTTTTNTQGWYLFAGLYDGTYTVEASAEGYAFTPATYTVTIQGADVTGQNFTSQVGVAISGTVAGDTKSGVTVTLARVGAVAAARVATTDANGNYRFWNVAAGTYLVTPSLAGGWTFVPANTQTTMAATSLTIPGFTAVAPVHALSGRVTGALESGVIVTLSGHAQAVVVTDGAGSFTFGALPPGDYVVTPSFPGYAFTPPQRNVTMATADLLGTNFVSVATHAISGTVSGDVLGNVEVSLSGAATATTKTDASGFFQFDDLVDGVYTVSPSATGYAFAPNARSVTLSGANATGVSFTASFAPAPTYTVSGTIGGGIPPGVKVTLAGATTAVTATDAAGAFSLHGVAPGAYLLSPSSDDYTFSPDSIYLVVGSADVTNQRFTATLKPTARTISGTVEGAATGGVTMSLVGPSPSTATRAVTTDATGAFAFRGLAEGMYLVSPSLPGFTFTPTDCLVTVVGPSVTFVKFESAFARHAISGTISPATAGVAVNLDGAMIASTTTAADGTYQVSNLVNGSYRVKPALAGYYFTPADAPVSLDGANVTSVDFVIAPSHRIAGHVSGDALAGVKVTLSGAAAGQATTDGAGYYEFLDLRDGGYVLTPALVGYSFDPLFLPTVVAGADVTTADFAAIMDPSYTVSGTISGAVATGVSVDLLGPSLKKTVTTDGGGVFVFTGVQNGSYMVIPSLSGYVFTPASRAFRVDRADAVGQNFTSAVAP